jgi:RNA polymerase sigma-70 factor, ECF subfamily
MSGWESVVANPERVDVIDFDERFEAMRPRLLAICRSLAGGPDAEDAVQETYVRGRRKVGQLREPTAFDAWLARIAVNVCYSQRRSIRRFVTGLATFETSADPRQQRDVGLRQLIERLPTRERVVVVLHYGHGYRLDEVADILQTSHTNTRSIVHRARRRLAAQWKDSRS